MALEYSSDWWVPVSRGLLAIIFGLLAIFFPALGTAAAVYLFASYFLLDGALNFALALSLTKTRGGSAWPVFVGLVGVVMGVAFFFWIEHTAALVLYLIAAWALVTGLGELGRASGLRTGARDDLLLFLTGLVLVILGAVLVIRPSGGLLNMLALIGVFFVVYGAILIPAGLKMRELARQR
jgi:uncharacterized membrane protein HdeD (DUF308 family)